MFEGKTGKDFMITQGYVPKDCTLPVKIAGPLIYELTAEGKDPCAECNMDRTVCHGREQQSAPTSE